MMLLVSSSIPVAAAPKGPPDYKFDGSISREVLENYLDRSISFTELLHDDLNQPRSRGVDPRDNIRMLLNIRAKFVGRALMCWAREAELDALLANAKPFIERLHRDDPDIVFQAAAFEIVSQKVETIPIPPRVFEEFGQPVTNRHFRFTEIIYTNGGHQFGNRVPDMSRLETRMWFYYLCTRYIDAGIEAIHFGQVGLMDENDRGAKKHTAWRDMLGRVRAYARQHARRHFVICDAHTPTGGYVEDGHLLFDAHAFPLRIAEVAGQPFQGVLKVGFSDSLYTRSKGGITPSGWACEHLPYLVEFDNFGGQNQGHSSQPNPNRGTFIWGWDEITWFATLPEAERNDWLRYSFRWLKENDPVAHLEMPGSRVLSPGRAAAPGAARWYWANTRSEACPTGSNTEESIKELWSGAAAVPAADTFPSGPGFAAKYPGDAGIEKDSRVIQVENFEQRDIATLAAQWESVNAKGDLSFTADVPPGSTGKQSLLMDRQRGPGGSLYRRLKNGKGGFGHDRVFARYYVKFAEDCGELHHFGPCLGGNSPATPWPSVKAGFRTDGAKSFWSGIEPFGKSWTWDFYTYWAEMRGSPPRGQTWGNSFIREPKLKVEKGRWICVEQMIRMNDVGDSNGEQALWLDGKLVAHLGKGFPKGRWTFDKFEPGKGGGGVRWNDTKGDREHFEVPEGGAPFEGFRWRTAPELNVNYVWLYVYTEKEAGHRIRVWYDDVVVATEYIGPLAAKSRE